MTTTKVKVKICGPYARKSKVITWYHKQIAAGRKVWWESTSNADPLLVYGKDLSDASAVYAGLREYGKTIGKDHKNWGRVERFQYPYNDGEFEEVTTEEELATVCSQISNSFWRRIS